MAAALSSSHAVAALAPRVGARRNAKIVRARRAPLRVAAAGPSPCDLSDLSKLPGDPSLVIHTNVAMGDKKAEFMKAASKAVADCLAKPEAFVVVAVMDEQDLIWGGEDTPCALCNLASLGSINKANNTRLSGAITALMSEFDVRPDRMYTNFWDIGQRENCGYNGVTFAEGAKKPEPEPPMEVVEVVQEEVEVEEEAAEEEVEEEIDEALPPPPPKKKPAKKKATKTLAVAKLKRLSDEKVLKLWRKKCPELQELWDLNEPVDTWEGITMDENEGINGRRVLNIELDEMGITGDLPVEIGGFDKLTVLALDGNEITGVPASIGMLKSLEQLYLSNNQINSVPAEIGELAALETLWLNNNLLTSIPPEIGQLLSLETLDLSENELTTLPAELADLELLEQLDIYDNPFTRLPADLLEDGRLEGQGCNIVREPVA